MSIASEITRLQLAKADIKTAIENKGVTVADNTKLDSYAGLVSNISNKPKYIFLWDSLFDKSGFSVTNPTYFTSSGIDATGLYYINSDSYILNAHSFEIISTDLNETMDPEKVTVIYKQGEGSPTLSGSNGWIKPQGSKPERVMYSAPYGSNSPITLTGQYGQNKIVLICYDNIPVCLIGLFHDDD